MFYLLFVILVDIQFPNGRANKHNNSIAHCQQIHFYLVEWKSLRHVIKSTSTIKEMKLSIQKTLYSICPITFVKTIKYN